LDQANPSPVRFTTETINGGNESVRRVWGDSGASQYAAIVRRARMKLVRFPLGVLWFGRPLFPFQNASPAAKVYRMAWMIRGQDWHAAASTGDYKMIIGC